MMEKQLKGWQMKAEAEMGAFLAAKRKEGESRRMPREFFELLDQLEDYMLRGGRKVRPTLFYLGYRCAGGRQEEEAWRVSIALEFLHASFLIHDDVMDRDSVRHNGDSMHVAYQKAYGSQFPGGDLQQFGFSMAICAGDAAMAWAYEILSRSSFDPVLRDKAARKLSEIVADTSLGQMLDEVLQCGQDFDVRQIERVQDYKTARYTIRGPIQMGAVLAGADDKELAFISDFALPLGVAYQIQNDIAGIFDDQAKMGKPVGSDIREGKKTLLVAYALDNARPQDREFILDQLGRQDIDKETVARFRAIMEETGALAHSKERIEELSAEAMRQLGRVPGGISDRYLPLGELAQLLVKG